MKQSIAQTQPGFIENMTKSAALPSAKTNKNQGLISGGFDVSNAVTLFNGDCLDLLSTMPAGCAELVVTSPPYNLGKEYEARTSVDVYLHSQKKVIEECVRILSPTGSICWQVGNYVDNGEIIPLDIILYPIFKNLGLHMRNRIIWHFGHGLHASRRFSGRYETILWFTKADKYYTFDIDEVRVAQKYPSKKHFKGPNRGQLSCNPRGKNPTDVWEIPNVKSKHIEKTLHPCQFPIGLIERLVLSMTKEGDLVFDPFMGAGTSACAAIINDRRAAGAEIEAKYIETAKERIERASLGTLRTRPMNKPVYEPNGNGAAKKPE